MLNKQTSCFRINFYFGFILHNRSSKKFRYWHASNAVDRIMDFTHLVIIFLILKYFWTKYLSRIICLKKHVLLGLIARG